MSISITIGTASGGSRGRWLSFPGCAALLLPILLCFSQVRAQSTYTVTAPPSDGSTTGIRAPNGTRDHAHHRTVTFVKATDLKLVPAGMNLTRLGFVLNQGADARVEGTLTVYLSNTSNVTSNQDMIWSGIVSGMTRVYTGPFTIPDTAGSVDLTLSTPFAYGGQSMYVAYEFQSSGPFAEKNAVFASNITLGMSTRSAFSSTEVPAVLNDISDFRPVLRFGFPIPPMQWNTVTSGIQKNLNSLDIVDDSTAWACSSAGDMYRTNDQGKSWLAAGLVPDSTLAIFGITKTFAVAVVGNEPKLSAVYLTSDGGASWNSVGVPALTFSVAVAGKTSSRTLWCLGSAVGDTVMLLTSADWGRIWDRSSTGVVLNPGARISKGSGFRSGNVFWFGTRGPDGAGDRVYKSSTGPNGPWRYSSTGKANVAALGFASASGTGFVAHTGCPDTIRRSTDGGLTWSIVVAAGLGEVSSFQYFAGGQDAWAATSTGIWTTSDDGLTWQRSFSTGNSGQTFSCLRFYASYQIGLAIGSRGLIVKGVWVPSIPLEIAQPSLQPTGYQLSANYPNPFNSSTWIEFSVPYQSSVTLKVMDVLGRELATLVSGESAAGRHRVEWKAGRNPSGVYFYRLVARPLSGVPLKEYSETQKLILLK